MSDRPYLIISALMDSTARAAAITRSHGDAIERAMQATAGKDVAGVELAELGISPKAFDKLRKALHLDGETVALYDVFPISSDLDGTLRNVAGQFLAAEALWALEQQGMLEGVPTVERFDLPKGWNKDPKDIRQRLVDAGAHNLSAAGAETYKAIKAHWDQSQAS
ncbi:MAG: hypothetical protein KC416_04435 [Myxococcales bacterium]|nr:hypothetical protein [Myxococcales bacterium]